MVKVVRVKLTLPNAAMQNVLQFRHHTERELEGNEKVQVSMRRQKEKSYFIMSMSGMTVQKETG